MAISRTERTELRRIVKNRFELLHGQVRLRENEIAGVIRRQLVKEHEDAVAEATKQVKAMNKEWDKLRQQYLEFVEAQEKLGIASEQGRWSRRDLTSTIFDESFSVKDLGERVNARMQELRQASGFKMLDLKQMEQEIQEELALGSLESDEAREFLNRIPTVDKLLPLPNGAKAELTDG